jgi:F0F1-type ATP synthase epsilon subunit
MAEKSPSPKLKVNVKSATKSFYSGEAESVTSYNDTGLFDILPSHANFICIIKDKVIIDKGKPTESEIPIDTGVLSVRSDKVNVYMGL